MKEEARRSPGFVYSVLDKQLKASIREEFLGGEEAETPGRRVRVSPLNATAPGSRFACRVLSARENERDCKASRGRQCRVWRKRPNVRPSGTPCGAPLSPAVRGITNVVATAPGERSHARGSSLPPPRSPSPFPSCANCIDFLGGDID